ncbi:WD40/YVTN repeat-like containing protein [Gracilaria domingensis]|nr:WD40/YVTN repeat-like containing protein [Gracilaria domingensis]
MSAVDNPFFLDREPGELDEDGQVISSGKNTPEDAEISNTKEDVLETAKPVWVDEDDDKLQVNLLKVPRRKKLRRNIGEVKISATAYASRVKDYYVNQNAVKGTVGGWAQLPSQKKKGGNESDEEGSEEEEMSETEKDLSENVKSLLQSTASLLKKRKRAQHASGVSSEPPSLSKKVLDLRILQHANHQDRLQAEARCVEFHPSGRLLLAAGLDKTVRIFQIEGIHSTKIQGIHMDNFPIHRAKFTGGGTEIVLTSRRQFFYQLDVESGKAMLVNTLMAHKEKSWEHFEVSADGSKLGLVGQQGKVIIMDNKSKREIGQLRHNGRVACLAFAPLGNAEHYAYSSTVDGTVRLWDVRKMSCVDAHKDEGAIHVTSLAVSNNHYAVGSDSGMLNVYPLDRLGSGRNTFGIRTETPVKAFSNLTTDIDHVKFNCDGQLMVFASHERKNALRVAHIPSMSVYTNWPTAKAHLRRVCSVAFSPKSGYLAVGNDKGDVNLVRIKAYPQA